MTEEKAKEIECLLGEIRRTRYVLLRLKEEREARGVGLDPNAPGPKHHVISVLTDEWDRLGEKIIDFFIGVMNGEIANEEKRLAVLEKNLEEL